MDGRLVVTNRKGIIVASNTVACIVRLQNLWFLRPFQVSLSAQEQILQLGRLSLASRSDGNSDLAPPSASQPHCGMQNDINEGAEEACPRIQDTVHFSV